MSAHSGATPGVARSQVRDPASGHGSTGSAAPDTGSLVARAVEPMSIALLGWARLSAQAREGSGYNLNASELARGLALAGHRVTYLSSGMSYELGFLGLGRTRVRHREHWAGVECFEIVNSPIVSPAAQNFGGTRAEASSPAVTRLVLAFLKQQAVQVVHVHTLEGYPFDVIGEIEAAGYPVVVTPHNYHFACPQVDLLYQEREVCEDYQGGGRCATCEPGRDVDKLRRSRRVGQTLERRLGMYPADVIRKCVYGVKPAVRKLVRLNLAIRPPGVASAPTGAALNDGASSSPSISGNAPLPLDMNERVVNNDKHLVVLNDAQATRFGQRRANGLGALRAASLITPPSDYVRRVYVSMGVPENRTRWVRLGQPHFDEINHAALASMFYNQRPWDPASPSKPLRFAFFGTTRANKGLDVFVRAIPLIDGALRARCHFTIRASGDHARVREQLRSFPEVSVWGGYDVSNLVSAVGEYDVGVLSHIWLENSPLVMLEHLHAGKFVIAPRLGGVVDFVQEPDAHAGTLGNGLMFPGRDSHALAKCIERLARGEVIVPSPREIHRASVLQSFAGHVAEVSGIYADLVRARRGRR